MRQYICLIVVLLSLLSCRTEVQQRVYGRYVPERKDDFAWENEYAAFRLYGPALRPENPSNGVDLWLKNSPALVVDTMYGRELKDHRPYHINYDGNLDCYKVGHTCGAGGLVIIADGRTFVGGPYDRWQIVEQSPTRLVFRLEYDSVPVGDAIVREHITITAEAGQSLNKAEVVLYSPEPADAGTQLLVGGGIYLHEHDTVTDLIDYERGRVVLEEEAMSDLQAAEMNRAYNGRTEMGRVQITVITPGATFQGVKDGNLVSVKPYTPGDTLTYYFGAEWSEWEGGKDWTPLMP